MPAYSFKERFIDLIKSGKKRQTIRAKRKGQAKPGDTLYLFYGLRSKWCTKIGEATCTKVSDILILATGVFIDGKLLDDDKALDVLAKEDGFKNWDDMWNFWTDTHMLPFSGNIIYWGKLKKLK